MRVLFFAQTRDAAGVPEMEMKISGSIGAGEFWEALAAVQPRLAAFRTTTRLARNGEYANAKTMFSNDDEVALIPPVSGG